MLDDLMTLFRVEAEVYHNAKVCGNWTIRETHPGQTCFHLATEGECAIQLPGEERQILKTGDLVIFPREIPHTMCPIQPLDGHEAHLPYDNDLPGTGLLCGRMLFSHRGFEAVLDALPAVIILRREDMQGWLEPVFTVIKAECYRSTSPTSVVINRLAELIFIMALRHFISASEQSIGLLSVLAEPKLAAVLKCIHDSPTEPWTIETLAHKAGLSRTALANQFRASSGWTVMQYLVWWRMQLAWAALQEGNDVASTAEKVGYRSEAAFSRAFQKAFGISAGAVRRKGKI
ncbi:AraC family transcriptional regulator [Parasalinivibrio latis]|uniref:AraC family transcriptional regulator n=1 Tax=Parasalinivibrio latis TaxID=2952610 RepID=UPI0030E57A2E